MAFQRAGRSLTDRLTCSRRCREGGSPAETDFSTLEQVFPAGDSNSRAAALQEIDIAVGVAGRPQRRSGLRSTVTTRGRRRSVWVERSTPRPHIVFPAKR